jgi:hypothetical protein
VFIRAIRDFYRRPWTLRRRLGWGLAAVNIIGILLFASLVYQASRQTTLSSIDQVLCAAAEAARLMVPPEISDQAELDARPEPQYTDTYHAAQMKLESYARETGLIYVYSIIVCPDDTAYELVSNLSEEQRASGKDAMEIILRNPYKPSKGMVNTARSGARQIDVAHDSYGYFRSCLVPVPTTGGRVTIFGADMEIGAVDRQLVCDLITNIGIGLLMLIVTLFFVRAISRSVARDVHVVVNETDGDVQRFDTK